MDDNRNIISKVLGRTDVISIGFGTIVGWSWIILAVTWVTNAGALGAILAFILGGMVSLSVGFITSELTSALPLTGGGFLFSYRAFGSKISFVSGWIFLLAYLGVAAWEGIALATAFDYIFNIPKVCFLWEIAGYKVYLSWALVGSAGACFTMAHNLIGKKLSILFQVMASAAVIIVVLIMLFGGIAFGDLSNIGSLFTDLNGFFYVFMLVPAMLIGFDVIPQSAGEMNIESKDIGHMIVVSVVLAILWYCLLIFATAIGAPSEIRESGILPVADLASYMFGGSLFGGIVVIGGILGIMTSWNGFFMGATRLSVSMSKAGMLPEIFSAKSKKGKVPVLSTVVVGTICMAVPFLGKNALLWLVDTSALCAMVSYLLVTVAYIKLRDDEPELHRPYKLKRGKLFAFISLIATSIYLIIFIVNMNAGKAGYAEFIVIGVWFIIGIIIYLLLRTRREQLGNSAIEYRIFGKKYARVYSDTHRKDV